MPIEGRKTVQLDGFKNTRKLEVGIMISCPMISSRTTSDEVGHNPQAPGPAKKQAHFLLKERPWKKLRFFLSTDDLIGVTQNLRVVKER